MIRKFWKNWYCQLWLVNHCDFSSQTEGLMMIPEGGTVVGFRWVNLMTSWIFPWLLCAFSRHKILVFMTRVDIKIHILTLWVRVWFMQRQNVLLFGDNDSFMYLPTESRCLIQLTRKIYEGKILGFGIAIDVHFSVIVLCVRRILPIVKSYSWYKYRTSCC